MSAIQDDPETQRKGMVFITCAIDPPILDAKGTFEERQAVAFNGLIMGGVPFRMACMHW